MMIASTFQERLVGFFHALWLFISSGTNVYEWASFGSIVLVGAILAYVCNRVVDGPGIRFLRKLRLPGVERLLFPVKLLFLGLLALNIFEKALDVFKKMPSWLWQWKEDLTSSLYGVVISISIIVFTMRLVDIGVEALRSRWSSESATVDESVALFIGRSIKALLLLIIGVVVLQNAGYQVTGLVTGLGFFGAAMALAAQHTIANTIGYFEILFGRLFKTGDFIAFGDHSGFVQNIGLRNVRIASIYGECINVPNKELVDKQIRNFTRGRNHRLRCDIGLTYDHDREKIEKAMKVLGELFTSIPEVEQHEIVFRKFGDSTLDFQVIYWAKFKTASEFNSIITRVHLSVKEQFDRAGIEFAFPTQTLHVKNPGFPAQS